MRVWFSSDQHLGGTALISMGLRQFKTIDEMNSKIVNNWNGRVKDCDIIYNVGDFVSVGKDRGVRSSDVTASEWESKLHGKVIHIKGNHDQRNGLKHALNFATMEAGGFKIALVHRFQDAPQVGENLIICGHVHGAWTENWTDFGYGPVLCVNVGVDVRKFHPVRLDEVLAIAQKGFADLKHQKDLKARTIGEV